MRRHRTRLRAVKVVLAVGILVQAVASHAQVTTAITSSGLGTTVTPPAPGGTTFVITGGTRPSQGSNLFHSFGNFSVGSADTALFSNTTPQLSTTNIVGRVTGGNVSNIFGTIDTASYPGANLFLLNPAGVVFGPGATLNVGGSFHVSTANYLRFANGDTFCVSACATGQPNVLSVAQPTAFGFLGPTPAPITIEGAALSVAEGQTLSVVAGNIQVTNSFLTAPSGRVQLASVAGAGEAALSVTGAGPGLDVSAFAKLGRVDISGSTLDVSDVSLIGAGTVLIRGGQLVLDSSSVNANTAGDVDGARVGVDLAGAESTILRNGTSVGTFAFGGGRGGDVLLSSGDVQVDGSRVNTFAFGAGNAGDIFVSAARLAVTGGGNIGSISFGDGASANITLTATESVTIAGRDAVGTPSLINDETFVTGSAGRISVSAPSLIMEDGGTILSTTFGEARGADIAIDVGDLSLTDGAVVRSHSGFLGRGGDIAFRVAGPALIAGISNDLGPTSVSTTSAGTAPAGDISFDVGTLRLTQGALITTGSITDPQGGSIRLAAGGPIEISAGSGISSQAFSQDIGPVTLSTPSLVLDSGFITTSTLEAGRAGDVLLNVGTLSLTNGGQVVSSSQLDSPGKGGNIIIAASQGISISGQAPGGVPVTPFVTDPSSGLFATASERATPDALGGGEIRVSSPRLTMSQGGRISVATPGAGPAGGVSVDMGQMTLSSGARIDSGTTGAGAGGSIAVNAGTLTMSGAGSGLFSEAAGTGPGGNISIQAGQIQLLEGATVSANSTGTADALAGNINILTSNLTMDNSNITTQSRLADGGSITITPTGSILQLTDSQITTSVQSGVGSGGNITIGSHAHPFDFIVLKDSGIHADAFGGPGGNVSILTNILLSDLPIGTAITASSALSTQGTINIQAGVTDVSGALAQLPGDITEAATLLRASCAARLASGKTSSLVLAGREGVPPEPDGLLWSPLLADIIAGLPPFSPGGTQHADGFPWLTRVSLDPKCGR
jgi:filamentous hemagglutinin family protein